VKLEAPVVENVCVPCAQPSNPPAISNKESRIKERELINLFFVALKVRRHNPLNKVVGAEPVRLFK
jgi:hypothetical protein